MTGLYQITSNRINLFKLGDVRNGCPSSRAKGSCIKRASIPDRIGIKKCWFLGEGKTGVPGEKPLGEEKRTNDKLDPRDKAQSRNRTPGHIVRARVLSPLHHPCSFYPFYTEHWMISVPGHCHISTGMNTEEFKYKWGGEDWDLLDRIINLSLEVERIKYPGLYHHYHTKKQKWG